jgi:hypothetical protein
MIAAFAHALRHPETAPPVSLRAHGDRFNVYRNNFLTGLSSALSEIFPVVAMLVGEEYFTALANAFVLSAPPRSPIMAEYGDGFAPFLDGFEPLASLPYIADVARLEWARIRAFSAPECPAHSIKGEKDLLHAMEQAFEMPRGATLLASPYPVGTIWAHHRESEPSPVTHWQPETVAIWRNTGEVRHRILSGADHYVLSHLATGAALTTAVARATDQTQATEFLQSFATLVGLGLIVPRP